MTSVVKAALPMPQVVGGPHVGLKRLINAGFRSCTGHGTVCALALTIVDKEESPVLFCCHFGRVEVTREMAERCLAARLVAIPEESQDQLAA